MVVSLSEDENGKRVDWNVIHEYGDQDALRDGILVPFVINGDDGGVRDTGYRITRFVAHPVPWTQV